MAQRRWTEPEALLPLDMRLVAPALALWAGCLVALWAAPATWWLVGGALAAALLLGVCAMVRRGSSEDAEWGGTAAGVAVVLVCLAVGGIISGAHVARAEADPLMDAARSGRWVAVTARVVGTPMPMPSRFGTGNGSFGSFPGPSARPDRWRIPAEGVAVSDGRTSRSAALPVTIFADGASWADVVMGSIIEVSGIVEPDTFSTAPGVTVSAEGDVRMRDGPPWWMTWAVRARQALAASASVLDADRGGLLRGLVVGDTAAIPAELSDDAKSTGLTHLVAVSGTHLAIIAGAVILLLRRAGPRAAAVGAGCVLLLFVVLVGPQPSVLRAAVMGAIGLAGAVLGRARAALPGLAAAVMGLLLVDPTLAVDVGFALSVQATAGLVLLAPPWTRALQRRGVPLGWAQLLVLPIAAHVTTMPVVAAISGNISLAAVPANIVVTPVVAPALLIGLLCLLVGPWWPVGGEWIAHADGPLLGWITGVAHRLADWPAATVPWPATPAGVITLALLTVAGLLLLRHRWARGATVAAVAGVVVALIPAQFGGQGWPMDGWLLTACDVGQGDGLVLSTGEAGTAVVVDTGPDPAAMDSCLGRLGITTIPLLVLTHLHADHVGGLAGAIGRRRVEAIAVGPGRLPVEGWQHVVQTAEEHGITLVRLDPPMLWRGGTLMLQVLGPVGRFVGTDSDPNNNSVVLMARSRGTTVLLTGDIELPAQRALLDSGVDLRADVLKQPHHGSAKLDPRFVAAVSPRVAVIGVGASNDYGHPAALALRIDREAGVMTILRTDRDGDVQVGVVDRELAVLRRGSDDRAPPAMAGN